MLKKIVAALAAAALLFGLTGCGEGPGEYQQRKNAQKSVTLKGPSLEKENLKEKLQRENDPDAVRYVYLISFAQPVGYYVIKGKVSSSGSQLAPEDEIIKACRSGCDRYVVDSAQDDGTYGTGDPGIFFFLANGTMVSTTLDYVESDQPLPLDVPLLGGTEKK